MMRVELAVELFSHAANNLHLSAIAALALDGWHRLLVEDDTDQLVIDWLDALPQEQREQWDRVMADAYLLEALEPASRRLRVTADPVASWDELPPRLPLREAARYLREPFNLVVEDAVSDREFLLAVATAEQRSYLLSMEQAGAFRFEHGGGLGTMYRNLSDVVAAGAPRIKRTAALIDSDALQPGQPSIASERVRNLCMAHAIPHCQLERRSIENYITRQALQGWAFSGNNQRLKRRLFRAFVSLTDPQRHHYNMKEGFRGDRKRQDATAGALYADLGGLVRADLEDGFGGSIADLYREHPRRGRSVVEEHLRADQSWAELSSLAGSIVKLAR